jgi:adenylyl cyclase-associated protein
MGTLLTQAFAGVRTVIVLASRAKAPTDDLSVALTPHLTTTHQAVQQIRGLKLKRDWDRHVKAVTEMLAGLSWVLQKAPKQLPSSVTKESLGSAEFWTNRIRKDYKGPEKEDSVQLAFCDGIKQVLTGLTAYIEEYHKTGLTFNPRGVSLAEAAIVLADEDEPRRISRLDPGKSPAVKRHPTLGTGTGGNIAGIIGELSKRTSNDGTSAATGLKHVRTLELFV